VDQPERWQAAMRRALYGPGGFFVGPDRPADHFRTSVHASPLFASALARLLGQLDDALDHPSIVDVVDVGAGRGELLLALAYAVPAPLRSRLRLTAVELARRPERLPPEIRWRSTPPDRVTGLVVATEWLDNVPVDLATLDDQGVPRYLLTDDSLGPVLSGADAAWLERWWPLRPGARAEIGATRDSAWRAAVSTVERGWALTVDYGHLAGDRPLLGTLTGYRGGRQVPPVPDGSCDLTAHVAFDALATPATTLLRQREALRALGVSGARPPLALASRDPAGYLRALAAASAGAELTDPAGLGDHLWLVEPVGTPVPGLRCEA
jgi:SAM-dependent MidA family methyltransferase